MKSLYLVMFFALLSYASSTHHLKTLKEHHYAPHHETHVNEVIAVHKPLPPLLPKIPPPFHYSPLVLHKTIPPSVIPVFPIKPVHKHHHKVPKFLAPPILKPLPVPVPVLVPVPALKHHAPVVPLDLALKPLVPFGKGHNEIKVHEHIDERYSY